MRTPPLISTFSMAAPSPRLILLVLLVATSLFGSSDGSAAAAAASSFFCPRSDVAFLGELRSQCPLPIDRSLPLEVTGDALDSELNHAQRSSIYAVLFYASWCPFSRDFRPIFNALSLMFPQIRHLAVEKSSAMPSVLSRYGIHGFPAILLVKGKDMVRYRGSRDISSLVNFYKETTGLDPVAHIAADDLNDLRNIISLQPQNRSLREIVIDEPFVAFSILFINLKMIICCLPVLLCRLRAFWVSHVQPLNLGVITGLSLLLARVLHVVDLKRLWSKLGLCNKTRNFRKGASNARVWASSLTSVSLGKSSSSRLAPLDS
ncbi:5'-adenylylsulfate reductase-like 5 [Ananas comosus]|uniref:5'-adenylylsulfate reductase-like 5 n=1 Tax=Ananas comosus TaxID=4615 RepID=A0A6P5FKJ2_ANACO|nr:5'-adenylylsulfate reductase-like 5 [Ananas comosus]